MAYKNRQDQIEAQRRFYKKNKEKIIKENNERRKKVSNWVKDYKSSLECSYCGESHPSTLDFHHKNSMEKKGEISQLVYQGWSKKSILKEIKKCEVLCANCHRKLHWEEQLLD